MESPFYFTNEEQKQRYISILQNYANDLIDYLHPNDPYITERKIALFSYIAVKPQYADTDLVEKLARMDFETFEFSRNEKNPHYDTDGYVKFIENKINIKHYPEMKDIESPRCNIDTVIHEMIHLTSYYSSHLKTLTERERFLEEGITDKKTKDIIRSPEFREICRQFNYKPKLNQNMGYKVEKGFVSLLNIITNGAVEDAHMFGYSEALQSFLKSSKGFDNSVIVSYNKIIDDYINKPKKDTEQEQEQIAEHKESDTNKQNEFITEIYDEYKKTQAISSFLYNMPIPEEISPKQQEDFLLAFQWLNETLQIFNKHFDYDILKNKLKDDSELLKVLNTQDDLDMLINSTTTLLEGKRELILTKNYENFAPLHKELDNALAQFSVPANANEKEILQTKLDILDSTDLTKNNIQANISYNSFSEQLYKIEMAEQYIAAARNYVPPESSQYEILKKARSMAYDYRDIKTGEYIKTLMSAGLIDDYVLKKISQEDRIQQYYENSNSNSQVIDKANQSPLEEDRSM